MNDFPWDFIAKLFSVLAGICCALGAWWCKGVQADVKELRDKEQGTQLVLAELKAAKEPREQLQDERWKNLRAQMESLQRNVEALVLSQLKPKE